MVCAQINMYEFCNLLVIFIVFIFGEYKLYNKKCSASEKCLVCI